jgi:hypothetical protein
MGLARYTAFRLSSNSSALRSSKSYHCGAADTWIDDDSSSDFDDEN